VHRRIGRYRVSVHLPVRTGPRRTSAQTNPHTQLDQQPTDSTLRSRLAARVFALSGVRKRENGISVGGPGPLA